MNSTISLLLVIFGSAALIHCSGSDTTRSASAETAAPIGFSSVPTNFAQLLPDGMVLEGDGDANIPRDNSERIYRGGAPRTSGKFNFVKRTGADHALTLELPDNAFYWWGDAWQHPEEDLANIESHFFGDEASRFGSGLLDYGFHPHDVVVANPAKGQFNTKEEFDAFLDQTTSILADDSYKPIYVHCNLGRDRTGLVIALHRMVNDHWGAKSAFDEMRHFGYLCNTFDQMNEAFNRKAALLYALTGDSKFDFKIDAESCQ